AKAKKGIPLIFHKRNNKPETVTMLKENFYVMMDLLEEYYNNV
ncbi:hypothetical protein LCGC14_2223650, partial [marine sediment metagenome]